MLVMGLDYCIFLVCKALRCGNFGSLFEARFCVKRTITMPLTHAYHFYLQSQCHSLARNKFPFPSDPYFSRAMRFCSFELQLLWSGVPTHLVCSPHNRLLSCSTAAIVLYFSLPADLLQSSKVKRVIPISRNVQAFFHTLNHRCNKNVGRLNFMHISNMFWLFYDFLQCMLT